MMQAISSKTVSSTTVAYRPEKEADPRAGRWQIRADERGFPRQMILKCPCGCGVEARLPLQPTDEADAWVLTGPRYAPTLFPGVTFGSERDALAPHWTGWLLHGKWTDTRPRPTLRLVGAQVEPD